MKINELIVENESFIEQERRRYKERIINDYNEDSRFRVNFKTIDGNMIIEDSKLSKQPTAKKAKKEVKDFLIDPITGLGRFLVKIRITSVDQLMPDGSIIDCVL